MVPGVSKNCAAPTAQERPEHMFFCCIQVREAWQYVREIMVCHQPELQVKEDRPLIRFLFPRNRMDLVQEQCIGRGALLLQPVVKGRLCEGLRNDAVSPHLN